MSDLERYGVRRTIGEILDYVRRSMVLDVLPRRVMGEGGGMDADKSFLSREI